MDQMWATLLVGTIGAAVAIWGVLTQRAIARRRATLDHLSRGELDGDLIAANSDFVRLAKDGGLEIWADESKQNTKEVQSIKTVLNDQELISIGIQRGIIDYKLYRMWNRTGVIRRWTYAEPFVKKLRERSNNDALYHEFEEMARWMKGTMPRRRWWRGLWS
jgi:hypothetical protein